MAMHANALVVMAKAPLPGMVKTRLVPPLSNEEAAGLYRCLLLDILDGLKFFARADLFVAFTPAVSSPIFQELVSPSFVCFPQRGEDLGERMNNIFVDLLTKGYKHIAIIGGDLPAFPQRFLEEAFVKLERSETDVVLGPSRDGGYYLIGMNRPIPEIFQGIAWSSDQVFSCTVSKLRQLGIHPHLIPTWFDIDSFEDLQYLKYLADQFPTNVQTSTLTCLRRWARRKKSNQIIGD